MLRSLGVAAAAILLVLGLSGWMERYFYIPEVGPTPVPRGFRGAESVWFNSADGTRLHGWFIPAQSGQAGRAAQAKPAPTILHVHGNAGNILSHIGFTEYLPHAGFNLFIFDYRGYGESEGEARRRGPLIADASAALDALLARRDIDPERIGLYGQSLGGAIGLNLMDQRHEIKAAVIESSFTSWRDMAACAIGGAMPGLLCRTLATLLVPDTLRPDAAIARIDRPILLLHGSADSIVPIAQARQLAARGNGATRLVELPGGDHNTLRETNPEIEKMTIDFFSQHLAADRDESRRSDPVP